MSIPHKIMQTSRSRLPAWVIHRSLAVVEKSFEYEHFTDEEIHSFFDDHPVPDFRDVPDRFLSLRSGEHKADLFRYYYLYVHGGAYFDTDVLLVRDIRPYLKGRSFVSVKAAGVSSALFQGFLCAQARHPVLHKAIADVCATSDEALRRDHHLLCRNLHKFLLDYIEESAERAQSVLILKELPYRRKVAMIADESNQPVLYHYWRRDYPPLFPVLEKGAPSGILRFFSNSGEK